MVSNGVRSAFQMVEFHPPEELKADRNVPRSSASRLGCRFAARRADTASRPATATELFLDLRVFPRPTPERCQERRRGVRPCALGQSADAARREVGACGLMQPRQMRACRQGETHRRGRHQAAPRCRATCGGRAARRLHLDRRHRQDPVRVPPRQSRDRAGHRAKPTPLHRSCARHSGTRWQLSFAGSSAPCRITVGPFGGNAAPGAGYG